MTAYPPKQKDTKSASKSEIDPSSLSFDPKQYVAICHACSGISVLREELETLKNATLDKTEQLKALVGAHFDQYLSCHEAVQSFSLLLKRHKTSRAPLMEAMGNLTQITDATLHLMLKRAQEQRNLRNAIHILTRFRPIFELTYQLKRCLQQKNYSEFLQIYARIQYRARKSTGSVLRQVLDTATHIAKDANNCLLELFDHAMLPIETQNQALQVLEALQFTDIVKLRCLKRQFACLEALLESLEASSLQSNVSQTGDSLHIVNQACFVLSSAQCGLWNLIDAVFQTERVKDTSLGTMQGKERKRQAITSDEAELVQSKAEAIFASAFKYIKLYAFPPSVSIIVRVNETTSQFLNLRKIIGASALNKGLEHLLSDYYQNFRQRIILDYIGDCMRHAKDRLFQQYFASASLQSSGLESKAQHIVNDAAAICVNLGCMMLRSKLETNPKQRIFNNCYEDAASVLKNVWNAIRDTIAGVYCVSSAHGVDAVLERHSVMDWNAQLCHDSISQMIFVFTSFAFDFMSQMKDVFVQYVEQASLKNLKGDKLYSLTSIFLVFTSNCLKLRRECVSMLETLIREIQSMHTLSQWNRKTDSDSDGAIHQKLELFETKMQELEQDCLARFVSAQSEALSVILRRATMESHITHCHMSYIKRSVNEDEDRAVSPPARDDADAGYVECRHYICHVLLLFIRVRSHMEACLSASVEYQRNFQTVFFQLTEKVATYLEKEYAYSCMNGEVGWNTELAEWLRVQIYVEVRFFTEALNTLMSENSKLRLFAIEKKIQEAGISEKALQDAITLLSHIRHRTKGYLFAIT